MNNKTLEVTQEDADIFAKNDPFGEDVGKEFVRRLVRAGRLVIVSGGLNDNQRCETAGQSRF